MNKMINYKRFGLLRGDSSGTQKSMRRNRGSRDGRDWSVLFVLGLGLVGLVLRFRFELLVLGPGSYRTGGGM